MINKQDLAFKAETFQAAKVCIALGWDVLPVHSIDQNGGCTCGVPNCQSAGKHPALVNGLKGASRDPDQIERWFGATAPIRNLGVVTGEISDLTVLDIDVGEGKEGDKHWQELTKEHGEPVTRMVSTGGGGVHVYFRYHSGLKTAANVLGKNIDCRNDSGYVLAPPSRHISGKSYSWLNPEESICSLPAHLAIRKENRGRPKRDDMYSGKYSIDQVESMLQVIPSDDRDFWRSTGIVLGRTFKRSDQAWDVYVQWANKYVGVKGRNHDNIMRESFYVLSKENAEKELTIGTIVKAAIDNGWSPKAGEVPIGNFVFYGPGNNYIYRPTISQWIAAAVDAAVSPVNEGGKLVKASEWLKTNQLVTSITCNPQIEEDYLKGHDCRNGEIVEVAGAALFNTYRKPTTELGDPKLAKPFLDHCDKVFNKPSANEKVPNSEQFLLYIAHTVQIPWEKKRFALMIAGGQGVGKDTAIEFCIPALGSWNVASIDPSALDSQFNEYAASTLVRISEAANLHEMSKWAFNERTKVLIAGSPDTCTINPKYGSKFSVKMHCGVLLTTNHLASGIYIPQDDRRYDVIECATLEEMGLSNEKVRREYFTDLWDWFLTGGDKHIAAYLHEKDISQFNPNNGQRKTAAHQNVIQAGRERHAWMRDIIEQLNHPKFVSFPTIRAIAQKHGEDVHSATFPSRAANALTDSDYVKYPNPTVADGRWRKVSFPKSFQVYAKIGTPLGLDPLPYVKAHEELF